MASLVGDYASSDDSEEEVEGVEVTVPPVDHAQHGSSACTLQYDISSRLASKSAVSARCAIAAGSEN